MHKLWMDYETFYDREYSLRRMSPAEYIMDPRFETLGCSLIIDDAPAVWVDGPDLPSFFASYDRVYGWKNTFAICHNGLFDHCISAWIYGVHPALLGDTMAMARNWVMSVTGRNSLDVVARYYERGVKSHTIQLMVGVGFEALKQNADLYRNFRAYADNDVELCKGIFLDMLTDGFPLGQLEVIDRQIRMGTRPKFVVNRQILAEHYNDIIVEKQQLLETVKLPDDKGLMSNDLFAALLMANGASHIPKKISKVTGKENWAFAKTDAEFIDLLDDPNPTVQALVAARLGHKSTQEESRTERFIKISQLDWTRAGLPEATMPIALKYSGARTHRFSGDWLLNQQNLPRSDRRDRTKPNKLRLSLEAPPGMVVVSVDASQVEARLNATCSEQWDLVDDFEQNRDVYSHFAELVFGYQVSKATHPMERFVGKTSILSLGYGSSWPTFQNMLRNQGGLQFPTPQAILAVELYRDRYSNIVRHWRLADKAIEFMHFCGDTEWQAFGPVMLGRHCALLPNGNRLWYHDLHRELDQETGKLVWWYFHGTRRMKLYGAKFVENIIQAIAFVLISEADLRIKRLTKGMIELALQVHDELIYVVPERLGEGLKGVVIDEMSRRPSWLPRVPLAAEGHIGSSYGAVK